MSFLHFLLTFYVNSFCQNVNCFHICIIKQKQKIMETQIEKFKRENNIASFEKLSKKNVIEALKSGAILLKVYAVYSYYKVEFADGSYTTNLRKDATSIDKSILSLVSASKQGISYKIKTI